MEVFTIEQLQFTGDESTSTTSNKFKLNFNHPTKELIWVVQPVDNVDPVLSGPYFGPQWFNYTDAFDPTYTSSSAFSVSDVYGGVADPTNYPYNANNPNGFNKAGGVPGVAPGGANNVFLPVSFEGGANPNSSAKIQLNGHDRFSARDGRYFNLVQPYQHHENVPSTGVNVYSFGLKPEEHQPSGTCNFSRIDSATLNLTLTSNTVNSNSGSRTAAVRIFAVNYNVLRIMSTSGMKQYSYMLVIAKAIATLLNCGNILIHSNYHMVKMFENWTIRSQALFTGKVQRLNRSGSFGFKSYDLRYSPDAQFMSVRRNGGACFKA